jgi:hypothetical protein
VAFVNIVKKPTIKTSKNAGQHPSVASLYRAVDQAHTDFAALQPST